MRCPRSDQSCQLLRGTLTANCCGPVMLRRLLDWPTSSRPPQAEAAVRQDLRPPTPHLKVKSHLRFMQARAPCAPGQFGIIIFFIIIIIIIIIIIFIIEGASAMSSSQQAQPVQHGCTSKAHPWPDWALRVHPGLWRIPSWRRL